MKIDLKNLFQTGATEDEEIAQVLVKAINKKASKQFDYLRFKHSIDSLVSLDLPLDKRVKSAFSTAQTMGLSKEKLIESLVSYEYILSNEKLKFVDALKKQRVQKVSNRESRIKELSTKRASIAAQIENLKKQEQACINDEKHLLLEINEAKDKIEETRKRFLAVYKHFEDIMQSDKEQIENLL